MKNIATIRQCKIKFKKNKSKIYNWVCAAAEDGLTSDNIFSTKTNNN